MPGDDLGELFETVATELSETEDADSGIEPVSTDVSDTVIEDADLADNPEGEPADVTEGTTEDDNPVDEDEGSDDVWDWEANADQLIPRTVNGVTEMVTLRELRESNMRQADYTQKTQEVAELTREAKWAQEVQEAFKIDPAGTLEAFAKAYGLDQGKEAATNALDELDDDIRPWAEQTAQTRQELAETKRQLAEIQNKSVLEDVRREVRGLKEQFGEDFDPEASLRLAAAKNYSLEDAHLILFAQKVAAGKAANSKVDKQVASVAEAKAAEANKAKQSAKAKASSTQTNSFRATEVPADDFNDIGELAELIMAEQSS